MWCITSRYFTFLPQANTQALGQVLCGWRLPWSCFLSTVLPVMSMIRSLAESPLPALSWPCPALPGPCPAERLANAWLPWELGSAPSSVRDRCLPSLLVPWCTSELTVGAGCRAPFLGGVAVLLRTWQLWFKCPISHSLVMLTFSISLYLFFSFFFYKIRKLDIADSPGWNLPVPLICTMTLSRWFRNTFLRLSFFIWKKVACSWHEDWIGWDHVFNGQHTVSGTKMVPVGPIVWRSGMSKGQIWVWILILPISKYDLGQTPSLL